MMNQDFDASAYATFHEAATEKYDFSTCQRPDGSYYGTGGTCRKGSPVSGGVPKKEKKGGGSGGGGGGSTLDKASRAEYGKQAKAEKQAAGDIKGEIKRNGSTPELEKKLKQTEARAEKFDRMSKTGVFESAKANPSGAGGAPSAKNVKALDKAAKAADKKADAADKKFQKSKSPADRKAAKAADKKAKDANKKADAADKKFQAAQKRANTKKRQQAFEKELDKRKDKMKGASPEEQSRLISEASKAASDSVK